MQAILIKRITAAGLDITIIEILDNSGGCFTIGVSFKDFSNNCSFFLIYIELSILIDLKS